MAVEDDHRPKDETFSSSFIPPALREIVDSEWRYQRSLLFYCMLISLAFGVLVFSAKSIFWLPNFSFHNYASEGGALEQIPRLKFKVLQQEWPFSRLSAFATPSKVDLQSDYLALIKTMAYFWIVVGFIAGFFTLLATRKYAHIILALVCNIIAASLCVMSLTRQSRTVIQFGFCFAALSTALGCLFLSSLVHLYESSPLKARERIPNLLFCVYAFAGFTVLLLNAYFRDISYIFFLLLGLSIVFLFWAIRSRESVFTYLFASLDAMNFFERAWKANPQLIKSQRTPRILWAIIGQHVSQSIEAENKSGAVTWFTALLVTFVQLHFSCAYWALTFCAQIYKGPGSYTLFPVGIGVELAAYILMLAFGHRVSKKATNFLIASGLLCLSAISFFSFLITNNPRIRIIIDESVINCIRFFICLGFGSLYNYILEKYAFRRSKVNIFSSSALGLFCASYLILLTIENNLNPIKQVMFIIPIPLLLFCFLPYI